MIQAAPEAFDRYLGSDRSWALAKMLRELISEADRAVLDAPVRHFHATGAIVDRKAPLLQLPKYDVEERDRLFEQLQRLRQQRDSAPTIKRRIAELEQKLNAMLKEA